MSRRIALFIALGVALSIWTSRADAHGFVGFLDYRHSLDPWESRCGAYRAHRRHLDADLHYVFHHMTGPEAHEILYGHASTSCRLRLGDGQDKAEAGDRHDSGKSDQAGTGGHD